MSNQMQPTNQIQNDESKKPWYKQWWIVAIGVLLLYSVGSSSLEEAQKKADVAKKVVDEGTVQAVTSDAQKSLDKENTSESDTKEQAKAIVDIRAIANKTPVEVVSILGETEKSEKIKPSGTICISTVCEKKTYQSGKFEIVFINNKADWITIIPDSNKVLNQDSIKLIGLPARKPSISNDSIIKWENMENMKEVSFFGNGSGKIDYIYIKVNSK